MINLRYHVVSLTAVFLAIGIGIAFGASMVNRATVAVLEGEVSDRKAEIVQITEDGADTAKALETERARAERFETEGRSRLLTGHINNMPVLAIAPLGTTQETIDAFERVALESESNYAGLIQFTNRLGLEDQADQAKMAAILERDLEPAELRRLLAERVSELLLAASADAPERDPDLDIPPTTTTIPPTPTTTTTTTTVNDPDQPETTTSTSLFPAVVTTTTSTTISEDQKRLKAAILADTSYRARMSGEGRRAGDFFDDLEREGFSTYTRSRARTLDEALTPNTEIRIVVLSDEGAQQTPAMWIESLVRTLAAEGVAPVVIAQPSTFAVPERDDEGEEGSEERDDDSEPEAIPPAELPPHDLVGRFRGDEVVSERLSTISHLTSFDGEVATVFALEDIPGRVGHYGPEVGTDGVVPDNSP